MNNPLSVLSRCVNLASLCGLLVLTITTFRPASAQSAPLHLRVDISDGNTGQLFVSWDQVSGATYYNVYRSMSAVGPWTVVADCSGASNAKILGTPWASKVCRDNDGGNLLTPGTTYYYQVQACNSTPCVGTWTSGTYANVPVTCSCSQGSTSSQIPPMRGLYPPASIPNLLTSTVTPGALYKSTANEIAAYPVSPSTNYRGILVVNLPGSDEVASRAPFLFTAQNLGFDVISVNYDSQYEQEMICKASTYLTTPAEAAACFTNISNAKLDFTGPCIPTSSGGSANRTNCGTVPGTSNPYIIPVAQDDVVVRITTLLQYLWCNGHDTTYTKWENYLAAGTTCATANPTPNWSKIILGGHSQGGGMATFAADHYHINRAINLSAPAQATVVNNVMTPASYFTDFYTGTSATNVRSIFGLVSQRDSHYNENPGPGVFQAIWQAIGYTIPTDDDAEWKLNVPGRLQPLVCSPTASNNFSTDATVSPGGGHADPTYIWNEDIFEYMLID